MMRDANSSSVVNQPFQTTTASDVPTTVSGFYGSSSIRSHFLAAATSAPPVSGTEQSMDCRQSSDAMPQLYNMNDDDVEEEIVGEEFAADEPYEIGEEEEEVDADEYDEEEEYGEEIPENSDDEGNDGPVEEAEEVMMSV